MLVTLEGMTISDRELHVTKTLPHIDFTPSGKTILDKDSQWKYLLLVDYQYYTL